MAFVSQRIEPQKYYKLTLYLCVDVELFIIYLKFLQSEYFYIISCSTNGAKT